MGYERTRNAFLKYLAQEGESAKAQAKDERIKATEATKRMRIQEAYGALCLALSARLGALNSEDGVLVSLTRMLDEHGPDIARKWAQAMSRELRKVAESARDVEVPDESVAEQAITRLRAMVNMPEPEEE